MMAWLILVSPLCNSDYVYMDALRVPSALTGGWTSAYCRKAALIRRRSGRRLVAEDVEKSRTLTII
jgi:hypothetical protein